MSEEFPGWHGTTIIGVRKGGDDSNHAEQEFAETLIRIEVLILHDIEQLFVGIGDIRIVSERFK